MGVRLAESRAEEPGDRNGEKREIGVRAPRGGLRRPAVRASPRSIFGVNISKGDGISPRGVSKLINHVRIVLLCRRGRTGRSVCVDEREMYTTL